MLNHEGKIELSTIAKEGKKKDGSSYKLWKYTIGGRIFSSFKSLSQLGSEMGEYVIVAYEEAPNLTHPETPYKNIVNLTQGVESKDVGEPTPQEESKTIKPSTAEPNWGRIQREKQLNIDTSTVFNQTCNTILSDKDFAFDKHFDSIYEKLWKLLQEKRKEKLAEGK